MLTKNSTHVKTNLIRKQDLEKLSADCIINILLFFPNLNSFIAQQIFKQVRKKKGAFTPSQMYYLLAEYVTNIAKNNNLFLKMYNRSFDLFYKNSNFYNKKFNSKNFENEKIYLASKLYERMPFEIYCSANYFEFDDYNKLDAKKNDSENSELEDDDEAERHFNYSKNDIFDTAPTAWEYQHINGLKKILLLLKDADILNIQSFFQLIRNLFILTAIPKNKVSFHTHTERKQYVNKYLRRFAEIYNILLKNKLLTKTNYEKINANLTIMNTFYELVNLNMDHLLILRKFLQEKNTLSQNCFNDLNKMIISKHTLANDEYNIHGQLYFRLIFEYNRAPYLEIAQKLSTYIANNVESMYANKVSDAIILLYKNKITLNEDMYNNFIKINQQGSLVLNNFIKLLHLLSCTYDKNNANLLNDMTFAMAYNLVFSKQTKNLTDDILPSFNHILLQIKKSGLLDKKGIEFLLNGPELMYNYSIVLKSISILENIQLTKDLREKILFCMVRKIAWQKKHSDRIALAKTKYIEYVLTAAFCILCQNNMINNETLEDWLNIPAKHGESFFNAIDILYEDKLLTKENYMFIIGNLKCADEIAQMLVFLNNFAILTSDNLNSIKMKTKYIDKVAMIFEEIKECKLGLDKNKMVKYIFNEIFKAPEKYSESAETIANIIFYLHEANLLNLTQLQYLFNYKNCDFNEVCNMFLLLRENGLLTLDNYKSAIKLTGHQPSIAIGYLHHCNILHQQTYDYFVIAAKKKTLNDICKIIETVCAADKIRKKLLIFDNKTGISLIKKNFVLTEKFVLQTHKFLNVVSEICYIFVFLKECNYLNKAILDTLCSKNDSQIIDIYKKLSSYSKLSELKTLENDYENIEDEIKKMEEEVNSNEEEEEEGEIDSKIKNKKKLIASKRKELRKKKMLKLRAEGFVQKDIMAIIYPKTTYRKRDPLIRNIGQNGFFGDTKNKNYGSKNKQNDIKNKGNSDCKMS